MQIREVQDQIEANQRHVALLAEHKAYLAKLEGFVAPAATVEMSKGVLNAETLKAGELVFAGAAAGRGGGGA